MRTAAHQFFTHQLHGIIAPGRKQKASLSAGPIRCQLQQIGICSVDYLETGRSAIQFAAADRFSLLLVKRNLDLLLRIILK